MCWRRGSCVNNPIWDGSVDTMSSRQRRSKVVQTWKRRIERGKKVGRGGKRQSREAMCSVDIKTRRDEATSFSTRTTIDEGLDDNVQRKPSGHETAFQSRGSQSDSLLLLSPSFISSPLFSSTHFHPSVFDRYYLTRPQSNSRTGVGSRRCTSKGMRRHLASATRESTRRERGHTQRGE